MTTATPRAGESIDLMALKKEALGQTSSDLPIVPREREFDVKYSAPDGNAYATTLVSAIKTGDSRVLVGQMASQMARGAVWVSLPPATQARIWALANISVQLREPPEWVLQWSQEDDSLLYGISRVLEVHEDAYFRGHGTEGQGSSGSSRLEILERDPSSDKGIPRPTSNSSPFGS